jgi:hypothetical protein
LVPLSKLDSKSVLSSNSKGRKGWLLSNAFSQVFLVKSGATIYPKDGIDSKGKNIAQEAVWKRRKKLLFASISAWEGTDSSGKARFGESI